MTIDLRVDLIDVTAYVQQMVDMQSEKDKTAPSLIHFGFYFDQDGWLASYFDPRESATRDGEWSSHLTSAVLLPRPKWHEASELENLTELEIINVQGFRDSAWNNRPTLENFSKILGDFIRDSILTLVVQGSFRKLYGYGDVKFCVEELTGLYSWPVNLELALYLESLKLSGEDADAHST